MIPIDVVVRILGALIKSIVCDNSTIILQEEKKIKRKRKKKTNK